MCAIALLHLNRKINNLNLFLFKFLFSFFFCYDCSFFPSFIFYCVFFRFPLLLFNHLICHTVIFLRNLIFTNLLKTLKKFFNCIVGWLFYCLPFVFFIIKVCKNINFCVDFKKTAKLVDSSRRMNRKITEINLTFYFEVARSIIILVVKIFRVVFCIWEAVFTLH